MALNVKFGRERALGPPDDASVSTVREHPVGNARRVEEWLKRLRERSLKAQRHVTQHSDEELDTRLILARFGRHLRVDSPIEKSMSDDAVTPNHLRIQDGVPTQHLPSRERSLFDNVPWPTGDPGLDMPYRYPARDEPLRRSTAPPREWRVRIRNGDSRKARKAIRAQTRRLSGRRRGDTEFITDLKAHQQVLAIPWQEKRGPPQLLPRLPARISDCFSSDSWYSSGNVATTIMHRARAPARRRTRGDPAVNEVHSLRVRGDPTVVCTAPLARSQSPNPPCLGYASGLRAWAMKGYRRT